MKPQKPYYEVSFVTKKRRKIFYYSLSIVLLVICIGFLIWGIISAINWFATPRIKSVQFHAVYVKLDAQNNQSAENLANTFKARGGAGVVIKLDNAFGAILAVYPKKQDAEKVKSQLTAQNISTNILAINTSSFSLSKLDSTQITITQNMYQKYLETIDNLYELSTQLDTNLITESQAIMRINELAILWKERASSVAEKIDITQNSNTDKTPHPLYKIYSLCLSVAGQLNYLAYENTYLDSLKSFVSVIRQVNYTLVTIKV